LQGAVTRNPGFVVSDGNVWDESVVDVQKAEDILCEGDRICLEILIQVSLTLLALEEFEIRLQLRGVKTSSAIMPVVCPAVVDAPLLGGEGLSKSLMPVTSDCKIMRVGTVGRVAENGNQFHVGDVMSDAFGSAWEVDVLRAAFAAYR
jgi:hypothetical protein